jgi:hypothetical protein
VGGFYFVVRGDDMIEVNGEIPTSIELFVQRLHAKADKLPLNEIERGDYSIAFLKPHYKNGRFVIETIATNNLTNWSNAKSFDAIVFELTPITSERTEVTAQCYDDRLADIFSGLCAETIGPYISKPTKVRSKKEGKDNGQRDSGHFNYSPEKRREIVKEFHTARDLGKVENREAWAQSNYNITGKTLGNYEKEFDAET